MKKMNSLNATVKLCQQHQIGISRHCLLELCKTGKIPSIRVGKTVLVNWDKMISYLDNNTLDEPNNTPKTGIRKISEFSCNCYQFML